MNYDTLRSKLQQLVRNDNFDMQTLKEFLDPIHLFVDTPQFTQNIGAVVDVITKDRDGNNQFDVADLKIMSTDPLAITSLVSSIILIICSIPDLKLRYDAGATEELVLKILVYVFLVIVPVNVGRKLTANEKNQIIDLTLAIHQSIDASKAVEKLFNQISAYFKTKGWCACMTAPVNTKDIVDDHLPRIQCDLANALAYNRSKKPAAIKEPEPVIIEKTVAIQTEKKTRSQSKKNIEDTQPKGKAEELKDHSEITN